MPAQPAPLWSTRVTHAPIPCMPVPCCHRVPGIFLTVLLSYAVVAIALGGLSIDTSWPCTSQEHAPPRRHRRPWSLRARAAHAAPNLCHLRGSVHPSNNARRQFPLKLVAMGFVGSVVLRTLEFPIWSASCSNWGMACSMAFNSARNTWLLVSSLPVALL
jgi:hypothetical protein